MNALPRRRRVPLNCMQSMCLRAPDLLPSRQQRQSSGWKAAHSGRGIPAAEACACIAPLLQARHRCAESPTVPMPVPLQSCASKNAPSLIFDAVPHERVRPEIALHVTARNIAALACYTKISQNRAQSASLHHLRTPRVPWVLEMCMLRAEASRSALAKACEPTDSRCYKRGRRSLMGMRSRS